MKPAEYFRNKKKEYLKAKTDKFATNNTIKNIQDLYRALMIF